MAQVAQVRRIIRFGSFEVDPRSGELRREGLRIKLQDQPFQVLQVLLQRPGEVITREELQQRIWPPDTFVDFDHGIHNAIKKLREALNDSADTPRYIETLPKRGYRFIGEIKQDEWIEPVIGTPTSASDTTAQTVTKATRATRKGWAVVAGALILILSLVAGLNARNLQALLLGRNDPPRVHSLAVLPLKNLSDDPSQEYFSYAMTEELITDLAQISGVKVISHTSVAQYAKSNKPLPHIARELGVDGIVEGTVQRSGNRVRITAQLIYAPEEQHLWAASYDRDFEDVFELQSRVAAAIVESIRPKTVPSLSVPPRGPSSPSPEAMEDYLQGNYSLERMGAGEGYEGYRSAIKYFTEAVSKDPSFAAGYLGLARTYDAQFAWKPKDIMPLEKAALRKALELDPNSAEAHMLNGSIKSGYDCDLTDGDREFKQALMLNPNLAEAHEWSSDYLYGLGRTQESIQEAQRAQELNPAGIYGIGPLIAEGHYDQAIERLQKHLESNPNDGFAYIDPTGLIAAYHFAGRNRESIEAMQKAWTLFGFKEIGEGVGKAYASSGYLGALRYSAKELERLYAEERIYKPDYIATWYAWAGDKEQSLKWLKIDLADNNYCWAGLDRDPSFVSLRSDPRFQELLQEAEKPH